MSTLSQIREGMGRAWESLAEGWHHLYEQASDALTRFRPGHGKEDEDGQLVERGARWGFLAAEVSENDKEIIVKLEAPGLDAEAFDIQIAGERLIIRGEKRAQRERKDKHYHLMECAYGRFERSLRLPQPVNESKSSASYKKGVLRIVMPKTQSGQSRRISVAGS